MNCDSIRLIQCDSTTGLMTLPANSVDVVVTSPYYNIGTDYGKFKDNDSRSKYLNDMLAWAIVVRRVLRPEGSLFLNIDGKATDPWVPFDVANVLREVLVLQNTIHWIKSIAINDVTVGHFKPINSDRFLNQTHEYIFHFTKTGNVPVDRLAIGVPYQDKSNVSRWASVADDLRCRGNSWFIPYTTKQKKSIHPAEFPVSVPDWCIRLHGLPPVEERHRFLVCDPFCGTGASGIASARLGVHFVGIDINSIYLDEAFRRIQQEVPEQKVSIALALDQPS
jgi:site-specific DNA-methyltransferase (adenine-specific)